jgi:hypothetical protein
MRASMVKDEEGGWWGHGGQKGQMGRLAAGPVGSEAEKNPFGKKLDFLIYQGFGNLHKEI